MLVAAPVDNEVISNREELRTIEDLHRANKRLSGALHIVLDTLDSENMGQLLERFALGLTGFSSLWSSLYFGAT